MCSSIFLAQPCHKTLKIKNFSPAPPNARTEFGIKTPEVTVCNQIPRCAFVVTGSVLRVLSLKRSSFVHITGRIGNITKIPKRPPALEVTPSSSGCRPPTVSPWLPSGQVGQAKWGSSPFPWLGEHWHSAEPPARHLFLQGTGRALGRGRLVVGTEQPLHPLPPGKPSTSVFLAFPKPHESRKSQSLTNLSLS